MNNSNLLEKVDVPLFRQDLINWFTEEQRELPWRENSDPYRVWVSEIMLQQTRVDTVIPYFNRFLEWFPSLESLADADEEKVLKAWEGLGYYSRVRNLQSAVREVKEAYGGIVPDSLEEISKLKGVGPYTAGAILSIAYGKPEPAVDGNVMRVLSRILLIDEDIAKPRTRKIFEEAVRVLIDPANTSFFNQALMELGALICTPGTPSCLLCPVREHCSAFAEGMQTELPVKSSKKKSRDVKITAAVITNSAGEILIRKRPSQGLLANLWEFPSYEDQSALLTRRETFKMHFQEECKEELHLNGHLIALDHVFSHLVWKMEVFTGQIDDLGENITDGLKPYKWVNKDQIEEYAFPVSHQKIWKAYVDMIEASA